MTNLGINHDPAAADVDEDAVVAPSGWVVDSEDRAAFAVDRVLAARARLDRITKQAAFLVEQAEKELARTEDFFVPQLARWCEENPPEHGRTRHFGTGSCSFRKVTGRCRIADPDAAVTWAKANLPAAVRRKVIESVVVDEMARHVRTLGDDAALPPGVVVDGDADSFHVNGPKDRR